MRILGVTVRDFCSPDRKFVTELGGNAFVDGGHDDENEDVAVRGSGSRLWFFVGRSWPRSDVNRPANGSPPHAPAL
jgi:hypothetical protein